MNYSFGITIKKTLVRMALVVIPLVLQFLPTEVQNLTVGALLLIVYDYLKHKVELKFLP